jgi:hypothetical protein
MGDGGRGRSQSCDADFDSAHAYFTYIYLQVQDIYTKLIKTTFFSSLYLPGWVLGAGCIHRIHPRGGKHNE